MDLKSGYPCWAIKNGLAERYGDDDAAQQRIDIDARLLEAGRVLKAYADR